MSLWTHIVAAIDADTFKESKDLKSEVEKFLENAPKITGSEGNATVFVNVLPGHNVWTSADCRVCEYGNTIVCCEEGGFQCDAPEGYRCPEGEYQTRVVVTVQGDLRDREFDETLEEWKCFKDYIDNKLNGTGYFIQNCTFNIIEG